MVELVELAGEVDLQAVREMTAVVEREAKHAVTRLEHREIHGHVRLRPGMGLHVRVLGPEQFRGPAPGELFDLVDDLAAPVVPLARVALGVLVRRNRPDGFEHARPGEVLGGDQLDLAALPLQLASEQGSDLRVDVGEPGHTELFERLLHDRHRGGS